jgi:RNA polymerase sigma factor (sigma-70 family)
MKNVMHLDKDERKFYRKHWTTGDPCLFDFVVNTQGLIDTETPEQRERRHQLIDRLGAAMNRLDKKIREVIRLYYLRGLTLQAIADKQGISVSTAYKRRERGLEKLRLLLQPFYEANYEG